MTKGQDQTDGSHHGWCSIYLTFVLDIYIHNLVQEWIFFFYLEYVRCRLNILLRKKDNLLDQRVLKYHFLKLTCLYFHWQLICLICYY